MKESSLISWSPSLSVGIQLIDDQRRMLIKTVNDLYNHSPGDRAAELAYFAGVLQTINTFVKTHFTTEERIMLTVNYPGYEQHKREHDKFVIAVANITRDFYEDKKPTSLSVFTHYLKDWILTHIAVVDKEYFDYLKRFASQRTGGALALMHESGLKQSTAQAG